MPKCFCGISAYFGKDKKATHCNTHKEAGMRNVVDALCEKCDKRASFNLPGKTGGIYCGDHKEDSMINVKCKRCAFIYDDGIPCYTNPIYNFDGELKGKFCISHKEANMVNISGKRCEMDGCKCIAQFIQVKI